MFRRLTLMLAAVAVSTLALTAPASAAVEASFVSNGPGWAAIYDPSSSGTPDASAGSFNLSVGGSNVVAFCVDQPKEIDKTGSFQLRQATAAWAPKVAWLAANHDTVGTVAADVNDEHAATQIAIWTFTNGQTVNTTTVPDPAVRTRALELVAAAQTNSATVPTQVDPALAVDATRNGSSVTVTARLSGVDNVSGQAVTFTAGTTNVSATTNASGTATATVPAVGSTITASWSGTLPSGVLLVPSGATQPVITAQSVPVSAQGFTPVPPAAQQTTTVPPTTVAPATTAAPATTVAKSSSGQLPYTGTGVSPWLAVTGVALAGLCATVVWRSRRRI